MPFIQFDIKTLLASEVAVCLLFALVMASMSKQTRYVTGTRRLAVNFLATACGISFFLMRGLFPHKIDVLLSNGLYSVSILCLYAGLGAMLQRKLNLSLPIGIAILSMVVLAFHLKADQALVRLVIITVTDLLLRLFVLAELARRFDRGVPVKMLTIFTGLFIACDALRVAATYHFGLPFDAFRYDGTQSAYIAISLLANCGLGIFSLALASRETAGAIEVRARRDSLTGALNRAGIEEMLLSEMERAKRLETPFCLALLDIDNFKVFNDTGGHALGDDVLRKIAVCVHDNLRSYDVFGRIGGDEFMLLLPGIPIGTAEAVCQRIVKSIAELPPISFGRRLPNREHGIDQPGTLGLEPGDCEPGGPGTLQRKTAWQEWL